MRFLISAAAGLALAGAASPAAAQGSVPEDDAAQEVTAQLADRLSDPAFQQELAVTVATLSQVLLDLPIAPIAEAAADMAGEEAADIDPDMTLRKALPGSGAVPQAVERELPRAMDRMAGMTGAFEAMLPALREAARQMEDAIEGAAIN